MPRLIRVALIALIAALCLPLLGGSAHAATPTKNTVYTDAKVDSTRTGKIKIKIGKSTGKIAKLTLTARCSDGSKAKIVRKSVGLRDGYFEIVLGPGQTISGAFVSKKKVSGKFRTALCGVFFGEFDAKK